jgi:predicted NBD/HSP70 family sugar kinase
VNLVDVDNVVLGGVYAALAPWLLEPVTEVVSRRVLAAPWAPVRVLPSRLGGEAAVRGAATAVVRDVIADPAAYLARLTPSRSPSSASAR